MTEIKKHIPTVPQIVVGLALGLAAVAIANKVPQVKKLVS